MNMTRWEMALAACAALAAATAVVPLVAHQPVRPDLVLLVSLPLALCSVLLLVRERATTLPDGVTPLLDGGLRYAALFGATAIGLDTLVGGLGPAGVWWPLGFSVWLAAAAVAVGLAAGFFAAQLGIAPRPVYKPVWVALAQPLAYEDGTELSMDSWYLATAQTPDGYVLRLDDGREVLAPAEAIADPSRQA